MINLHNFEPSPPPADHAEALRRYFKFVKDEDFDVREGDGEALVGLLKSSKGWLHFLKLNAQPDLFGSFRQAAPFRELDPLAESVVVYASRNNLMGSDAPEYMRMEFAGPSYMDRAAELISEGMAEGCKYFMCVAETLDIATRVQDGKRTRLVLALTTETNDNSKDTGNN